MRLAPLLLLLAACGDSTAMELSSDAGELLDAPAEPDAGRDAVELEDAGELDAGAPDAGPDTGPTCVGPGCCEDPCTLVDADACDVATQACRLDGCSTYCAELEETTLPAGELCDGSDDPCRRRAQCLEADGAEHRCTLFCRVGNDGDCAGHPDTSCLEADDLRDVDGELVMLPAGYGVCG